MLLDQPTREFAGAGGFTGSLQTGQHHDHRPLRAQIEAAARLPHEPRQLLMHDLDEGLPGGEAFGYFYTDCSCFDGIGEGLDDAERDIGVEQREPYLADRGGNIVVGQSAAAGQRLERRGETGCEAVEHAANVIKIRVTGRVGWMLVAGR